VVQSHDIPLKPVAVQADIDDPVIVRRCLSGDTGAFAMLVERYHRVLFTVAVRMLGDREDARDATQTAFVRAFERLDSYRPEFRFFSWLYRILTNECLSVLRARRPHGPIEPDLCASDDPLTQYEADERRRGIQSALMSLTSEYREVIVLRHFAGLSYGRSAPPFTSPCAP
jgi:RNA polymerase sigma-70 factor (ECF subfamily)